MKNLIITFFLFITSVLRGQSVASDVIYVYNDNSCVVTITQNIVGLYVGGKILTSQPNPYTYNTPFVLVTRLGADIRISKDVSIMVGNRMPYGFQLIEVAPEIFVKIRLVNTIKQTKNNFDLTLMSGYSNGFMVGMGICLPMN